MLTSLQRFGLSAELWIAEEFRRVGFDVYMPSYFRASGYDMLLDGFLPVHVKAARLCRRSKGRGCGYGWRQQFNTTTVWKSVDFDAPCLIVLLASSSEGFVPFFVPVSAWVGRGIVASITSDARVYSGWLAQYRFAWSVVHTLLVQSISFHTLPLFSQGVY